ncbi:single-stranded-DNA-specific exonuclease RecJ [Bacteroidetes/Chlorobi group bacterium Naka2016]|jgi:single-stranded-DNA-specific exonuclease|nr:MAG: single-stranded-DNA-specific exonuclease RecJ [Bacteroidetes/Chlorobi group bacterium Naka2016]
MSQFNWKFRGEPKESIVKTIVDTFKIPRGLAKVLVARGLDSPKLVEDYFNPSLDNLYDPFLLKDMDKAVERILRAIKNKELICIHGDYDVDGTTSTSMLIEFLRNLGGRVIYHIPDRFQEGYGIIPQTVKQVYEMGVSLIITVDVGITSVDAVKYAKEIGIDTIICDHHEPGPELPPAYAILDPLLPDSNYPFKHLAACGVVFKLVQAISKNLNREEEAFKYLDYVAIASAADMVPLVDENRILSYFGLKLLNEKPRPGIKGLLYCTNLKPGNLTTFSIIYSLAPLINAAGRLGDAMRSVEMMIQQDEIAAFQMAQQLEQDNRMRRYYDEKTFEEAIPLAEKFLAQKERRSLILHKDDWHAGVIGIVASRLVDKYNLPTILLTTMYNLAKGSARSIINFDIHSALKECGNLLEEFGGHKHAAGLSLKLENLPTFIECFDEIAHKYITPDMLTPELVIDAEINLSELSPRFFQYLHKFAPFGFENNKPVFLARGIFSKNGLKMFGANNFRFRAVQPINVNGGNLFFEIDAVGQNLGEKIKHINSNKPFSMVFVLEEVSAGNQTQFQLRVKDVMPDS